MSVVAPAVLQQHDSKKYSESRVGDPAIANKTEGGYQLTRPRYTRRPARVFTLGFTSITDAQKSAIMDLYDQVMGGSDMITGWLHPTSGAAINIRFKQGSIPKPTYKGHGGNHLWDVSNVVFEEV